MSNDQNSGVDRYASVRFIHTPDLAKAFEYGKANNWCTVIINFQPFPIDLIKDELERRRVEQAKEAASMSMIPASKPEMKSGTAKMDHLVIYSSTDNSVVNTISKETIRFSSNTNSYLFFNSADKAVISSRFSADGVITIPVGCYSELFHDETTDEAA